MHLWTAVDLTGQLEAIRKAALTENQTIGLSEAAFTLPAHVSLKISFQVPDEAGIAVQQEAAEIFRHTPSFNIRVKGLQQENGILWIAMEENAALRLLHEKMVALAAKNGAPAHPFDGDFRYHSTLFLSPEEEKLDQMEKALLGIPLPAALRAEAFLIGGSETGLPGEYRVFQRIPAMK